MNLQATNHWVLLKLNYLIIWETTRKFIWSANDEKMIKKKKKKIILVSLVLKRKQGKFFFLISYFPKKFYKTQAKYKTDKFWRKFSKRKKIEKYHIYTMYKHYLFNKKNTQKETKY